MKPVSITYELHVFYNFSEPEPSPEPESAADETQDINTSENNYRTSQILLSPGVLSLPDQSDEQDLSPFGMYP